VFSKVKDILKPDERVLFVVVEDDIQEFAKQKIGRKLNDEELYSVSKGIEAGLSYGLDVVFSTAIDDAINLTSKK